MRLHRAVAEYRMTDCKRRKYTWEQQAVWDAITSNLEKAGTAKNYGPISLLLTLDFQLVNTEFYFNYLENRKRFFGGKMYISYLSTICVRNIFRSNRYLLVRLEIILECSLCRLNVMCLVHLPGPNQNWNVPTNFSKNFLYQIRGSLFCCSWLMCRRYKWKFSQSDFRNFVVNKQELSKENAAPWMSTEGEEETGLSDKKIAVAVMELTAVRGYKLNSWWWWW